MGIEEVEEFHAVIENVSIIAENLPIQFLEAHRAPNRQGGEGTPSPRYYSWNTEYTDNNRELRAAGEKHRVACKGKNSRTATDFSIEALKAKRTWDAGPQILKDHSCKPKLLCPEKWPNWRRNMAKGIYDHQASFTEDTKMNSSHKGKGNISKRLQKRANIARTIVKQASIRKM